jgi:phosphoribosyl 1,2-cyclic phosphate phosphodiesterase
MDHFYAHDFILRGYKYTKTSCKDLHIYGNTAVCDVYRECTRRELRPEVAATIHLHEIQPFEPFSFDGYTATALLAQHSKTENAYVYLVEKDGKAYLHLTDTGRLPEETLQYLAKYFENKGKGVDLVTFDCTFLFHTAGEVFRHMGLEDNRVMKERLTALKVVNEHTRYVITHYSHNANPLSENLQKAEKEYGVIAAYDGTRIEI